MAGLLTAEGAELTSIPRQLVVSLSPRPKLFICRFQSVDFVRSFGRLLDQGASPPKMRKSGAKALKVRAEYQAATQNEAIRRASYPLQGERMDRLSQGNQKAFLPDSSRRVAQEQRWRADRECPKAVPNLFGGQRLALH